MVVQGTAVIKFDNEAPITLQGQWRIESEIPGQYFYGQGNGSPGSGYIGATIGTAQRVSGSFNFIVDATADLAKRYVFRMQKQFFTADWIVGDPLLGKKGQAVDCRLGRITHEVDDPEGRYMVSATMSAGKLQGPAFD